MSSWPHYASDEIEAVVNVLKSGKVNYWTGNEVKLFEQEFAAYCQVRHAIALANGTLALELALYALDIGPGDEVIVPAKTFMASASCAVARGATPVIADVDLVSQNLTVETVKAVMTPRTKAIIAVHLAGWPCEMDKLMAFAKAHNLYVIEDCAQAHGAYYQGKPVGAWGHMAAFSFCQDKIMSTGGEGGMLVMNDETLWKRAWAYKDHGKDYDVCFNTEHPPGFRWLHTDFGSNWRLTEMQAAIGRLQLKKLPEWSARRQQYFHQLNDMLRQFEFIRVAEPDSTIQHAAYKFYCFTRPEKLPVGWSRDRIMQELNALGVPSFVGSCSEIYLEKCFEKYGYGPKERLPNAKQLSETGLVFLIHPTISEMDMKNQIEKIRQFLCQLEPLQKAS